MRIEFSVKTRCWQDMFLCAGSFLVVPCGQYKQTLDSPTLCTAYVYARGHWNQPFLRLPSTHQVGHEL